LHRQRRADGLHKVRFKTSLSCATLIVLRAEARDREQTRHALFTEL